MENNNHEIDAATYAANKQSVVWWGIGGWFFHVFVVVIAYLHTPKIPPSLLQSMPKDVRAATLFESAYTETLKQRRIKAAWIGTAVLAGLWLLIFIAAQG